jgi:hypothetical protein
MIHRRIISVFDSVGNIITDGICVLHRRKKFIGKTVKSCSVTCNLLTFQNTKTSFLLLLMLFLFAIAIPDIALDFLHRCPRSATTMDEVLKSNALFNLSKMPQIFPSASRLAFWQQWIYSC